MFGCTVSLLLVLAAAASAEQCFKHLDPPSIPIAPWVPKDGVRTPGKRGLCGLCNFKENGLVTDKSFSQYAQCCYRHSKSCTDDRLNCDGTDDIYIDGNDKCEGEGNGDGEECDAFGFINCPNQRCTYEIYGAYNATDPDRCDMMAETKHFLETFELRPCGRCGIEAVAIVGEKIVLEWCGDSSNYKDTAAEEFCLFFNKATESMPGFGTAKLKQTLGEYVKATSWEGNPPPNDLPQQRFDDKDNLPAAWAENLETTVANLVDCTGGTVQECQNKFDDNIFEADQYDVWFGDWQAKLGVSFENESTVVQAARKALFANTTDNLALLQAHLDEGGSGLKLAANAFAAFSEAEFFQLFLGLNPEIPTGFENCSDPLSGAVTDCDGTGVRRTARQLKELPDSVDWRDAAKNPTHVVAVSAVKNQGSCGCCWSFATTGALEGLYAAVNNMSLISLSEQHLVNCDTDGFDNGCNGGNYIYSLDYTSKNPLTVSKNVFYTGTDTGACNSEDAAPGVIKNIPDPTTGRTKVLVRLPASEAALMTALAKQPVAVAVNAGSDVFKSYSSGVLDEVSCGDGINHAVLAVGYGTDEASGLDYWIVKNSWGYDWGEDGYIRLARGEESKARQDRQKGTCGVLSLAVYPTYGECASTDDDTCESFAGAEFCSGTVCYSTSIQSASDVVNSNSAAALRLALAVSAFVTSAALLVVR